MKQHGVTFQNVHSLVTLNILAASIKAYTNIPLQITSVLLFQVTYLNINRRQPVPYMHTLTAKYKHKRLNNIFQ
jgi:hypothetical protein